MEPFKHIIRPGTIEGPPRCSIFCKIEYSEDGRLSITGVEGPTASGNAVGSCGQIDMHLSEPGGLDSFEPADGWDKMLMGQFLAVWQEYHLNDMRAYDAEMRAAGWHRLAVKPMLGYEFTLTRAAYDEKKAAETAALEALRLGETFRPTPEQVTAATRAHSFTWWIAEEEAAKGEPESLSPAYERARHIGGHNSGGVKAPERKTLGWLKPSEHPEGLLTRKLRPDGPGYGSAWFKEEVPADVLEFLRTLPPADRQPAWV